MKRFSLQLLMTLTILSILFSCVDDPEPLVLPEPEFEINDGDYEILFENQKEYGINIMILGEGYTRDDIESGRYKELLTRDVESFFNVYPMSVYKQHFNVYLIYAISRDEGVSIVGEDRKSTAVGVLYDPEVSPPQTHLQWSRYRTRKYAKTDSLNAKFNHVTFISMNNPDDLLLGGVATLNTAFEGMALYPTGNIGTMVHEFGHAFAALGDEYTVEDQDQFTDEVRQIYRMTSVVMPNIDTLPTLDSIKWKKYFEIPGYEEVGAFEGASYMEEGMWRPEELSIMGGFGGFNAPSREAIAFRIATLARFHFDFDEYIGRDLIMKNTAGRSAFGLVNFQCDGLHFVSDSEQEID